MDKSKVIFAILIVISFAFVNHKDRIEKPNYFRFTYEDNSVDEIKKILDPKLKTINNKITTFKKEVKRVEIKFETGEKVVLSRKNRHWYNCEIRYGNDAIAIPKSKVKIFEGIFFPSIELLWKGGGKNALTAEYFYLRFGSEETKSSKNSQLFQIDFENGKFVRTSVYGKKIERLMSK